MVAIRARTHSTTTGLPQQCIRSDHHPSQSVKPPLYSQSSQGTKVKPPKRSSSLGVVAIVLFGLAIVMLATQGQDEAGVTSLKGTQLVSAAAISKNPVPKVGAQGGAAATSTGGIPPLHENYATMQDPWLRELLQRLDRVRQVCGELCTIIQDEETYNRFKIDEPDSTSSLTHRIEVPSFDCPALLAASDIDVGDTSVPRLPPDELYPHYTLNGMIQFYPAKKLHRDIYLGGDAKKSLWTKETIKMYMDSFDPIAKGVVSSENPPRGTYGPGFTRKTYHELQSLLNLTSKSVLVVGSEVPWLESICLHLGASKVTTLEYGSITSEHPQISTLLPSEFRSQAADLSFDAVVSVSSLEHSGLGRYGDGLNPWGDLLAVARAWCVTKPGGFLYLAMPTGLDLVQWNAHRVYGKKRWPLVTANWVQVPGQERKESMNSSGWGAQEGFAFQKPL